MSTSTLTNESQTTIPKDVRTRLNLHPGDRLESVIDEDGRVLVLPVGIDASELAGMLKPPARLMAGQWKKGTIPTKWDGKTAARIVEHLERLLVNE
jgi:AbrB family looped-hinge helix DNA binding protein